MTDRIAYKILNSEDSEALAQDRFAGSEVDRADGFIHLSTAGQLAGTLQRHFPGQHDLSIATIDLAKLGDAVRWQPSRDGALFPHLYGPLPREAVIACERLDPQ